MDDLTRGELHLSGDGATIVVRADDELRGLDARAGELRWRAPVVARAVATLGDAAWVVTDVGLTRLPLAPGAPIAPPGAPPGAPIEVPGADGPLCATAPSSLACGGARAWVATVDARGASVRPLPACELAIPLGGARAVCVRGGGAELRRDGDVAWTATIGAPGDRAVAGAALLEARVVAVCLTRGDDEARIVVLDARTGAALHALAAPGATAIAFAPRRGWALVRIGRAGLTIVDLRFGRVVARRDEDAEVAALAVDDAFTRVALRLGDALAVADGAALWQAAQADAAAPHVEPVSLSPAPAPDDAPTAPAAQAPDARPALALPAGPLPSLAAPDDAPRATAEEAAVELQARLYWVGALADHAIAAAWDCGRIAAPSATALPFEHEVTGVLHRVEGRAVAQRARAARHLAHYRQVVAEVTSRRGDRVTPLARLAGELGLSPLAEDVLMVAAAPLLWGELARLYGILANDEARPLCDELLVAHLLEPVHPRGAIARELDPDRPLRRSGVLHVDARLPRPFGALRVEPTVVALLRGVEPAACVDDVVARPATRGLDQLRLDAEVAAAAVRALGREPASPARLAVRGGLGSGRRALAAALAARCGRTLGVIDATATGAGDPDRAARLAAALRRCRLVGWIPCVEGLDDVAVAEHPERGAIQAVLAAHPGPVVLRLPPEAVAPLAPGHLRVELRPLPEGARAEAWAEALARRALPPDDAAELAARFKIGPGLIERGCEAAVAALAAPAGAPPAAITPAVATRAVDAAVRQHLEERLGTVASRVTRLAGWADLVAPEDVLDSLLELIARVRRRRQVYEAWGYDRRLTTARGVTALFQGGPGTGKTLAAGVIARELGLDLYRVDVARVVSKWVGETEKNLAAVFDAAEDGQAVLLFDEADSLFSRRTEVRSSVDRYANLEVNYLLQRLDAFGGIAILTTNLGGSIDPAFKRRLGMRLTFPFPDDELRERVWRAHVPAEVPRAGDLDFAALAQRYRLSGGYIRNAALRAAFLAAEEGVALAQGHLERAIRLEFREVGKLSESGALE